MEFLALLVRSGFASVAEDGASLVFSAGNRKVIVTGKDNAYSVVNPVAKSEILVKNESLVLSAIAHTFSTVGVKKWGKTVSSAMAKLGLKPVSSAVIVPVACGKNAVLFKDAQSRIFKVSGSFMKTLSRWAKLRARSSDHLMLNDAMFLESPSEIDALYKEFDSQIDELAPMVEVHDPSAEDLDIHIEIHPEAEGEEIAEIIIGAPFADDGDVTVLCVTPEGDTNVSHLHDVDDLGAEEVYEVFSRKFVLSRVAVAYSALAKSYIYTLAGSKKAEAFYKVYKSAISSLKVGSKISDSVPSIKSLSYPTIAMSNKNGIYRLVISADDVDVETGDEVMDEFEDAIEEVAAEDVTVDAEEVGAIITELVEALDLPSDVIESIQDEVTAEGGDDWVDLESGEEVDIDLNEAEDEDEFKAEARKLIKSMLVLSKDSKTRKAVISRLRSILAIKSALSSVAFVKGDHKMAISVSTENDASGSETNDTIVVDLEGEGDDDKILIEIEDVLAKDGEAIIKASSARFVKALSLARKLVRSHKAKALITETSKKVLSYAVTDPSYYAKFTKVAQGYSVDVVNEARLAKSNVKPTTGAYVADANVSVSRVILSKSDVEAEAVLSRVFKNSKFTAIGSTVSQQKYLGKVKANLEELNAAIASTKEVSGSNLIALTPRALQSNGKKAFSIAYRGENILLNVEKAQSGVSCKFASDVRAFPVLSRLGAEKTFEAILKAHQGVAKSANEPVKRPLEAGDITGTVKKPFSLEDVSDPRSLMYVLSDVQIEIDDDAQEIFMHLDDEALTESDIEVKLKEKDEEDIMAEGEAINEFGETFVDVAERRGFKKVASMLKKLGVQRSAVWSHVHKLQALNRVLNARQRRDITRMVRSYKDRVRNMSRANSSKLNPQRRANSSQEGGWTVAVELFEAGDLLNDADSVYYDGDYYTRNDLEDLLGEDAASDVILNALEEAKDSAERSLQAFGGMGASVRVYETHRRVWAEVSGSGDDLLRKVLDKFDGYAFRFNGNGGSLIFITEAENLYGVGNATGEDYLDVLKSYASANSSKKARRASQGTRKNPSGHQRSSRAVSRATRERLLKNRSNSSDTLESHGVLSSRVRSVQARLKKALSLKPPASPRFFYNEAWVMNLDPMGYEALLKKGDDKAIKEFEDIETAEILKVLPSDIEEADFNRVGRTFDIVGNSEQSLKDTVKSLGGYDLSWDGGFSLKVKYPLFKHDLAYVLWDDQKDFLKEYAKAGSRKAQSYAHINFWTLDLLADSKSWIFREDFEFFKDGEVYSFRELSKMFGLKEAERILEQELKTYDVLAEDFVNSVKSSVGLPDIAISYFYDDEYHANAVKATGESVDKLVSLLGMIEITNFKKVKKDTYTFDYDTNSPVTGRAFLRLPDDMVEDFDKAYSGKASQRKFTKSSKKYSTPSFKALMANSSFRKYLRASSLSVEGGWVVEGNPSILNGKQNDSSNYRDVERAVNKIGSSFSDIEASLIDGIVRVYGKGTSLLAEVIEYLDASKFTRVNERKASFETGLDILKGSWTVEAGDDNLLTYFLGNGKASSRFASRRKSATRVARSAFGDLLDIDFTLSQWDESVISENFEEDNDTKPSQDDWEKIGNAETKAYANFIEYIKAQIPNASVNDFGHDSDGGLSVRVSIPKESAPLLADAMGGLGSILDEQETDYDVQITFYELRMSLEEGMDDVEHYGALSQITAYIPIDKGNDYDDILKKFGYSASASSRRKVSISARER